MAKTYHKNNLAKARKFWHCNTTKSPLADCPNLPELASNSESDTDSDCGYEGGVSCKSSSDECGPAADLDEDWSNDESLAELEGDELEANLYALQEAESKPLDAPTAFKQMMVPKDAKEWKRAEGNQVFGYTKNSTCTQERRRKEAWDWEAFWETAKTS